MRNFRTDAILPAITILLTGSAFVTTVSLTGCGSKSGTLRSTTSTSGIAIPTGTFTGRDVLLSSGQTATLSITTRSTGTSTGTVRIIGDGNTATALLSGPVDLSTGQFTLTGVYTTGAERVPVSVTGMLPRNGTGGQYTLTFGATRSSSTFNGFTPSATPFPSPSGSPTGSPTPGPSPSPSPSTSPTPTPTPTPTGGTLGSFFPTHGADDTYTYTETSTHTSVTGGVTTGPATTTTEFTTSGSDFGSGPTGNTTQVNLDGSGPLVTRQETLDESKKVIGYSYFVRNNTSYTFYGTDTLDSESGQVATRTRFVPAIQYSFNLTPGQSIGPITTIIRTTDVADNTTTEQNYTYKLTYFGNESVTVPAGTFNCARFGTDISFVSGGFTTTLTSVSWYAKNVGEVKSHSQTQVSGTGFSSNTTDDSILKSARVNGVTFP